MNASQYPVFTIGHSTHSIEFLIDLLQRHDVTAVADVRSVPYSRFNPQFNQNDLERALAAHHIKYVFLGKELGARSEDPSCYENGRVQYGRLVQTECFRNGIERVIEGTRKYRIALMCAEKEPLECHRTILVSRALVERGIPVEHILPDGRREPHWITMQRLLDAVGLPSYDFFRPQHELIDEALARQEERIAYVDGRLVASVVRETP